MKNNNQLDIHQMSISYPLQDLQKLNKLKEVL